MSSERAPDHARVRIVDELPLPTELVAALPLTDTIRAFIHDSRCTVARVLSGLDPRLLVIVGPCSIHDVPAALAYAEWLTDRRVALGDRLVIVMRVYVEKPRTRIGWKGLINDPALDHSFRMADGLRLARRLMLDINRMGVPTATEFVDPLTAPYLEDLVSWVAIGARTAESQVHRELASALPCPVGFKNGTSGDVRAAVNAVIAAREPHYCLGFASSGRPAVVVTGGNPHGHIVLRGGPRPNYDEASVRAAAALLEAEGLAARLMVDCSHGNCQGDYRRQLQVARDVVHQRRQSSVHVCGVMVESNLVAGSQRPAAGAPVSGLSVTDPCLGLDDTAAILSSLAGADDAVAAAIDGASSPTQPAGAAFERSSVA